MFLENYNDKVSMELWVVIKQTNQRITNCALFMSVNCNESNYQFLFFNVDIRTNKWISPATTEQSKAISQMEKLPKANLQK